MDINEELLKENVELRKKVNGNVDNKSAELASKFIVLSKKPMKIHGVLIAEGVWKGVLWKYEEMKNCIDQFKKLKLLMAHGNIDDWKDKDIGKMTKVEANDMLRAILFEASVTDAKAQELIINGTIDAVSVKGMWKNLDTGKIPPEGRTFIPHEFSLTSSPACYNCLIFNYELERDISMSKESNEVGEIEMSDILVKEGMLLVTPKFEEDQEEGSFELVNKFNYDLEGTDGVFELAEGYYPENVLAVLNTGEPKYPYYRYRRIPEVELAKWTRKYINDLPNSAFAVVEPCADKNKNARHLPYKDATGKIDLPHLRNARARMNQIKAVCPGGSDESLRTKAKRKLGSVAKTHLNEDGEEGVELSEYSCFVCEGKFEKKKDFRIHWLDKHERSFGSYAMAKNLAKALLTSKELRNRVKGVIELSEEKKEEASTEVKEETTTETKVEEKKEETTVTAPAVKEETKPTVTRDLVKEVVMEVLRELKPEKKEEVKKEETVETKKEEVKEEVKKEEVVEGPKEFTKEEAEKLIDPHKAAELLVKSAKGTHYGEQ